jgi:hypothetical protein
VVGKVKHGKAGKEAERIGFSIIRDLGGEKVIFESFSTYYYDDDELLMEAMGICKSAGKDEVPARGIYKLEGDTLTVCYGTSGGERPKEFKTTQEAGILFVLKCAKK